MLNRGWALMKTRVHLPMLRCQTYVESRHYANSGPARNISPMSSIGCSLSGTTISPGFALMHSGTDPPQGRDSSSRIGLAEANGCSLSGTSISPGFALMHSGIDLERGRLLRKQIDFCEDSVLDDHYVIGSRRGADSRQYAGNDTANGEVLAESPVVAQIYACEDAVLDGHYVIGSRRGASRHQ